MNSIHAKLLKTKYGGDAHLVICLDDQPLDQLVAARTPGSFASEGLVPTLLDWVYDPRERAVIWSRALPRLGDRAMLPVLMCPDDSDFSCTIVVTEVHARESDVIWERLGFDRSDRPDVDASSVGDQVEWIDGLGPFRFQREPYEECLNEFRKLHKQGTT